MISAPKPSGETARLAALAALDILDTLPEQAYDDITLLASRICETPMALVSLVDVDRQWSKSRVGVEDEELSRDLSFCAHAILEPEGLFVIDDAIGDERFSDHPMVVGDPGIRFYAGAPLTTASGHALGTLCVIDTKARRLTTQQSEALHALSRQVMAQLELRRVVRELETSQAELARLSLTDPLTGLVNRRAFMATLNSEMARQQRYGHDLALALIDLDGFKTYNDTMGHVAGDKALEAVAKALDGVCRTSDTPARYGGDEFALILPETGRAGAHLIAERFRHRVSELAQQGPSITVSVGVAMAGEATATPEALVELADAALYRAKAAGRNQVA